MNALYTGGCGLPPDIKFKLPIQFLCKSRLGFETCKLFKISFNIVVKDLGQQTKAKICNHRD